MPYLRTILKKGSTFVLRGRVIKKQNRIQMGTSGSFSPGSIRRDPAQPEPIYGLTSGLSNKTITKTIRQLLENLPMYSEFLSEDTDSVTSLQTLIMHANYSFPAQHGRTACFQEAVLFLRIFAVHPVHPDDERKK